MSADGQDKFISIVQEVIELRAVKERRRRLNPVEVAGRGQDKLFASILWPVGHLSAAVMYGRRESCTENSTQV